MSARLIHLLRHGETVLPGRLIGRTDCHVSPDGIAACVDQVEGLEVATIVSSDLIRAHDCADAAARLLGRPLKTDPRWRELDFGEWDGQSPADLDPAALGRFWNDPDGHAPPGGERWSALVARIGAAIDALPEGPVLVVTHGGAMRAALAVLFGFDQRQLWAFDLPCAALLTIRAWPDGAQIVGLNP